MTAYIVLIIICGVTLSFISSVRLAYFLCKKKWNLDGPARFFTCAGSGVAAAVLSGFMLNAAIAFGGVLYGLVGVIFCIPLVGLAWVLIVGSNKAIERIISGLLAKV